MKNKGFTLVELLGVLVILAIIFVLVFPTVNNILSQSKETVYQQQINNILNSAYDYSLKNINYLPEYNQKSYITLGELKYEGLIAADIKNPNTGENFSDNLVISIHNVGAGYDFSNVNAKLEGNYLYTVEIEKLNDSTIEDLLPEIVLEGDKLTQNSDGNYIMILDLNEKFPNITFKATSSNNEDLINKVKKYILIDNTVVENIDSSKPSIYKVNYSVIDNEGYASATTLNVIIADTIPPTITLPEDTVISENITSYDLLKNVSCEDNSGFCDIEYSGEEELYSGASGKHIITYTAKDPSGNTTTKERVITIE